MFMCCTKRSSVINLFYFVQLLFSYNYIKNLVKKGLCIRTQKIKSIQKVQVVEFIYWWLHIYISLFCFYVRLIITTDIYISGSLALDQEKIMQEEKKIKSSFRRFSSAFACLI